jgi:hypothetical protein
MTFTDAEHVFERLFRTERSRDRRHGGAGLGLAIVAAIVQAHGGPVELITAPGAGSRFRVVLPAEASDAESDPDTDTECDADIDLDSPVADDEAAYVRRSDAQTADPKRAKDIERGGNGAYLDSQLTPSEP